ncbi:hypothetical protein DENSPDRAFT_926599 [Dentipellis sp. KUC8613]|nr:hypothetical protein DENSPDRAFT_926599 [Dentipellis sp. KUC8613]
MASILTLQPLPFSIPTHKAAGLPRSMRTSYFSFVSFFVAVVSGQRLITTTDDLGNTIVEQVTTDALGDPITQIIQTLASTPALSTPSALSTTTTTSSLTSTTPLAAPVQQGPVGQPGPTAAQGETPFVYTTTDADGDPTVVQDVFTPSFPATTPADIPSTGTILGYSEWLGMIGNATSELNKPVGTQVVDGGSISRPLSVLCSLLAGLAAGAALVFS